MMKYRQEISIDAPIEKVLALFDDPESQKYSHPGLVGVEHVSGAPGQPGAKSVLKYGAFDLIETVLVRDLPGEFTGSYKVPGMSNTMKSSFSSLGEGKTKYTIEMDYKFETAMEVMPGKLEEQTHRYLELFKEFVENHA
jgi:carbon monoxide dehydrogenase subunit G